MKKKLPIILVAVLGTAICVSTAALSDESKAVAEAVWGEDTVEATYAYRGEFRVPERSLTVGDKMVAASAVVEYPDGTSSYASTITLDQFGTYVVKYSAVVDGKVYRLEDAFDVAATAYTHSNKTTVTYGLADGAKEKEGLLVNLAQGDALTFTQYFDVADLTSDNCIFEAFATTSTVGVYDFSRFVITLTDSQDSNCYVEIVARRRDVVLDSGRTFFYAGANGQDKIGVQGATVHKNDTLGTLVNHSFDRRFSVTYYDSDAAEWKEAKHQGETDKTPFRLSFDYATKELYVDHDTFDRYGVKNNTATQMITDLDNMTYYDTAFGGFPSGKVQLSISAEAYASSTANFCVTSVLGYTVEDLKNNVFTDNGAPVITVNNPYESMPEGNLGGEYPVLDAKAYDLYSGACDVNVSVWYNYQGETPVMMDMVDGKFVAKYVGYYALVYCAKDSFGNTAEEIVWVHAGGDYDELSVVYDEAQAVDVAYLGDKIALAPYSVTGGSGATSVKAYAVKGETKIEIKDEFIPEEEGGWTILYEATDFIGNEATANYKVTVTRSATPILTETVDVQKILLSGYTYALPVAYAKDYSSGSLVEKLCDVKIEDANGVTMKKAGECFVPTVVNNGDVVKITYSCEGVEYKTFSIPTVVGYTPLGKAYELKAENYFSGENITLQKSSAGMVVATAEAGDAGFTFANTLVAEQFSMDLRTVPARTSFSELQIVLTDAQDYTNEIVARLVNKGNYVEFAIGESSVRIEKSFASGVEESFVIGYANGSFTVDKSALKVTETVSGEAFNDFNDKVYVQVKLLGSKANNAVKVYSMNGYRFTETNADLTPPYFVAVGSYGGSAPYGSYYTMPAVRIGDVIDPNLTVSMTVTAPDGQIVKDINGALLQNVEPNKEYVIQLNLYGAYQVSYTAKESSTFSARPRESTFGYAVTVADKTGPVITLTSNYVKEAKVGDVIVMPDFTVADDQSAAEKITVFKMVINPNGVSINLTGDSNAIKCAHVGVYEFRITAMDETGNLTLLRLYVTVTEGGAA